MWIYYFDYNEKTIINNKLFHSLESAKKAAIQFGKAFDNNGIICEISDKTSCLIFDGLIQVYLLKLLD
jgi:hypothetical protein